MEPSSRRVAVVWFSAGSTRVMMAADAVTEIGDAEGVDYPHICTRLGLQEMPTDMEQRLICIRAGSKKAFFVVDEPMTFDALSVDQLFPTPRSLPMDRLAPIVGFAREDRGVGLVLEASYLVD